MQSSLTLTSIAALFITMIVLGAIPSVSVLIVSARSAASGFIHGVFTTMGIVVGDIIFIIIAIFGLSLLADRMGNSFSLIKYLGGTYLIWLGITLWRKGTTAVVAEGKIDSSLKSSFLAGLFITLGDQKAILFYLGFFPAYIDLSTISYFDASIIMVIAAVAICVPKLFYAYLTEQVGLLKESKITWGINIFAGSIIIAVGVFLMVKTML